LVLVKLFVMFRQVEIVRGMTTVSLYVIEKAKNYRKNLS